MLNEPICLDDRAYVLGLPHPSSSSPPSEWGVLVTFWPEEETQACGVPVVVLGLWPPCLPPPRHTTWSVWHVSCSKVHGVPIQALHSVTVTSAQVGNEPTCSANLWQVSKLKASLPIENQLGWKYLTIKSLHSECPQSYKTPTDNYSRSKRGET